MNTNNFFVIDVGNTEIVIALIKNFKIIKWIELKLYILKKKNYLKIL